MIDISNITIGKEQTEQFAILQDGFNGRNEYVQMVCRLLDGKSEGAGIAISFATDIMEKQGDYLPITMDKAALSEFIDWLNRAYQQL